MKTPVRGADHGKKSGAWFSDLPLALRMALAVLVGAVGGFGQAPYGVAIVLLFSAAAAFYMLRGTRGAKAAGAIGWAFGFGYFAHTLLWIVEPFQVDAARDGWMAPFALVLFAGGLALFWAAAFWGARRVSGRTWPLMLTWAAAELARAYVFTGFPWAGFSQIVVDGTAARALAWAGPHGTTLWLLSAAWVLSFSALPRRRRVIRTGQIAVCCAMVIALHGPQPRGPAALSDHLVRLVQPNAAQHLKWQADMVPLFYQRQLDFTAAPSAEAKAPDLIIWPETAIPWRLDVAQPAMDEIAQAAGGVPVVLGMLREEAGLLRNALVVVGPDGQAGEVYDKHHLVPFGEYLPFAELARALGLRGLAESRGPGFGAGTGPQVLDFGAMGRAVPLICYEAVFAHGVNAVPERADFLIQITNDAWFGARAGPQQHLAQARMRAIEQGLPLLRAANTGISAIIDPYGRLVASLPLGQAGFVDGYLPLPIAATPYSRFGDWPVALTVLIGIILVYFRRGRLSGKLARPRKNPTKGN